MKKMFCVLIGVLYSFSSLASYNLDNLSLEGLWQLKDYPSHDSKEKILYDFKLNKTHGVDPDGFRLSYFKNQQASKSGIDGIGLFVMPSCRQGRFNYFLRLNRTDYTFQLFEIIDSRGYPDTTALIIQKSGSPKVYALERVQNPRLKHLSQINKVNLKLRKR
ncbi:MAG: hypothetical protein CME68_08215 [Halobacteriovoraceae bacterium]|nr:hypothetical protein [Halobacteriovoraceae bacterium]|tara:strand:+ start:501 stop:986 length:486 start_codon:yes stop_codon:yes gene_type:complete